MQTLNKAETAEFNEREKIVLRDYATFIGQRIKTIRPLTKAEIEDLAWEYDYYDYPGFVIIFEDGQAMIPSCDPEGNAPGFLIAGNV